MVQNDFRFLVSRPEKWRSILPNLPGNPLPRLRSRHPATSHRNSFTVFNENIIINNILLLPHPARRALSGQGSEEPAIPSDDVLIGVELVVVFINRCKVVEVNLVSKQATYTTETLDELGSFL